MKIEQLSFKLKSEGYRRIINDIAEILGESIYLVEEKKKKSFNKVIATQLRILLCEGEDSLILKGGKVPVLAPVTDKTIVKEKIQQCWI